MAEHEADRRCAHGFGRIGSLVKTERHVRSRLERAEPQRDDALTRTGGRVPVLVVGPVPPPYHGGATATQHLLDSGLATEFRLVHVDTSDRRGLENIGRLDVGNIILAVLHFGRFMHLLVRTRPQLVYVPVAQNRLGFLRDCLFLFPALAARKPVVIHLHGGGFASFANRTDWFTRGLVGTMLRRVRRVIVLGEKLGRELRPLVATERIAIVPNGIQDAVGVRQPIVAGVDRLREAPLDAATSVLYLGTLMEAKGFLDLIEAVKRLVRQGRSVRLVLAGAFFRASDRAQAETAARGFESHIDFAGVVHGEAKVSVLRSADIFAFPTRYENEAHPYVLLEAMAAGLPVIATPRAAIPETVLDGTTGMLIPEGDIDALERAIASLDRDRVLRQRMGEAGRDRFEALYTLDRWSECMAAVLRDAIAA